LVEVLNKIQQECGTDNVPFAVTDVSYIAFVNKDNKLEGIITIQKRARETIEDYIDMVAMLALLQAFHIGNDVQSETAQGFRWCPVSGEYGRTQASVAGRGGTRRSEKAKVQEEAQPEVQRLRDPRMSEQILTHKHQVHKQQTHNHAASGWRIHCGVEVTESSTNKQLSHTHRAGWEKRECQRTAEATDPPPAVAAWES
jgi:hypothetical protein